MSSSMPFKVTMPDGTALTGRDWPLPGHVTRRGAALLIHGVGEHSGRYDHVADALQDDAQAAFSAGAQDGWRRRRTDHDRPKRSPPRAHPLLDCVVVAAKPREFVWKLPDGTGCLLWYEHLFHEIYNESPPDRARVLVDLQTWVKSQL